MIKIKILRFHSDYTFNVKKIEIDLFNIHKIKKVLSKMGINTGAKVRICHMAATSWLFIVN